MWCEACTLPRMKWRTYVSIGTLALAAHLASAQVPNPTSQTQQQPIQMADTPIFRVQVVARTTQAVNYLHRGGTTTIGFEGTALLAAARGSAKVESERGDTKISAEFKNLTPASSFGPEYLTYVLWAISPDGRPVNLGELVLNDQGNGSSSKINTTSDIQTFGMIVTAEPYYGVTQPSDVVVMENVVRPDTRGVIEAVNAHYELLPRGMYTAEGKTGGFAPIHVSKKDPFELYEAENALQIARIAGAEQYASESFSKAQAALDQALRYEDQKPGQKPVITMAREAVVRAEDARVIAIRAERIESDNNEKQAALDRENAAKMKAAEEARARAQADSQRNAAEQAKTEALAVAQQANLDRQSAEQAKLQADQARQAAEQAKLEADQARQAAIAEQQKLAAETEQAKQAAADADALRLKAEQDQAALRQQLLVQLNTILQTRDTARGLIVNMSDVLFDTAKYSLKPGAREKLAKVAGIIISHPGLKIAVEGHTDSVGGDEYNMKLSENRAGSVRDYLVTEGVNADSITAQGFGKTKPVADNATAAGRQANRRVELVVSGEILGTSITGVRTSGIPQ